MKVSVAGLKNQLQAIVNEQDFFASPAQLGNAVVAHWDSADVIPLESAESARSL